jgi:hypothetical protein
MGHYEDFIKFAEKFIGVTETTENCGYEIAMFQQAVDGVAKGEPWCMAFIQYCAKEYAKKNKIRLMLHPSEHCLTVWNNTGTIHRSYTPKLGYIVIWKYKNGISGHCGIVTRVGDEVIETIEGNTSPSSKEVVREGDTVARKTRSRNGSKDMKIVGYINPFEVKSQ